ncbi:MAG TPA: GntR family transcriptional regulator [Anaerovoracaceae bacterium]|nr:GntR family transcriptional regulator [Anaerovoracaceae bacterium]
MIDYKTVSLANQVYETLEMNILNGKYEIGQVISENKLSEELGVSRTPIREAMTKLAHERLIGDSPNGAIVLGITEKDIEDIFTVKRAIEVTTTMWAAENMDAEGLKEMKDIIEQQEFYAGKGESEKVRNLDTQFHDLIYKYSKSPVMDGILEPMHKKMLKYRAASLDNPGRTPKSVKEHQAIYDAMVAGDMEKVREAMTTHVENSGSSIMHIKK